MPLRQLLWISGSAALVGSIAIGHAQEYSGDMTSYTLSSPMSGNCNFMAAPAAASQNYAALNSAQWDSTKNCGRCAQVSCADARCKDTTKTEIVYLLDQCPECKQGDLDVSPSVFKSLTGSDPSRYKIKWQFVDCPVTGNLKYCLKSGSNPYYAAVQPANAAAGIKSVTINAQATSMVPSAYYYVLESNIDLSSVKVSVTSLSGETVTETVALKAGACTDGTSQFTGTGGSAPAAPPAVTPSAAPVTTAPVSPTPPTARPTPTTKQPAATPAPGATTATPTTTAKPPRTEVTKTPAPSSAADADTDADVDEDEDKDEEETASPASTTATPATTTVSPATTTPAANATSTTTPAPAVTTETPVVPSTPKPTKKVSCRRLED